MPVYTGWFRLEEGDMLWVRDKDGSNNPEDDALRFYFVSRYVPILPAPNVLR